MDGDNMSMPLYWSYQCTFILKAYLSPHPASPPSKATKAFSPWAA